MTEQHELNPRSGRVHAVTSQRAQTGPLLSATAAALQFLMLKADIHANSELTHAKTIQTILLTLVIVDVVDTL